MSQGRMRKGTLVSSKSNGTNAQVADDSHIRNNHHNVVNIVKKRSISKNKIPKNVRYELENALVDLCDVWFEEIKPHLVRNNIKLHVHGTSADRASGDYKQQQLTPAAPPCSHIDPGAALDLSRHTGVSYVNSCLTQLTALKVPSHKPQARSRQKIQPPLPAPSLRACVQDLYPSCEATRVQRPYTAYNRKNRRPPQTQPGSNWRVPRLCRTYSVIPSAPVQSRRLRISNGTYQQYVSLPHRQKVKRRDKSTQTELSIPIGHDLSATKQTHSQRPREYSAVLADSRLFCRQRTNLLHSPTTTNRGLISSYMEPILFQDNLIDSICEKHDKRLKIIYNNPRQVSYPSEMNLVSSNDKPKKYRSSKKTPWR